MLPDQRTQALFLSPHHQGQGTFQVRLKNSLFCLHGQAGHPDTLFFQPLDGAGQIGHPAQPRVLQGTGGSL